MENELLTSAQCDGSEVFISSNSKSSQPVAFRAPSGHTTAKHSFPAVQQLLVMFKIAAISKLGLHENNEQSSAELRTTASADIKHALAF